MDNAKSNSADTRSDANTAGAALGLPSGAKIGKYEVKERLAIGGQAFIYKCYDSLLDRFVAIKQISSHLAEDAKFLDRFRKEAQILARVGTHQPAIVTIYELIEDERGLFIVMEHISGLTLEASLAESTQPVDPKDVLQILWRLAAALKDVHAAGIIHRDIKPGNIIVTEGLRPKITDFGVAASLTGQTSMLLGTTKYMAPELVNGDSFDGRADMYSLGFIAYEMLLGREKFNEVFADVVRDKHSEAMRWMKWHGNNSVLAPKAHELIPAIPQGISDIVAKMLAKNVADRYENMESLGRALKACATAHDAQPIAPRHRSHRRSYAAVLTATGPAGGDKANASAFTGDHGGQSASMDEGPATVPLPKKRMAAKRKLLLAAIVMVSVIVLAAVLAIQSGSGRDAMARQAKGIYETADKAYQAGDYKTASDIYARLIKDLPSTDEAAKASVMLQLAQGYQAIEARDWNTAADKENAARDKIKAVNRAKGDLYKWSQDIDAQLREFGTRRLNTRGFVDVGSKVSEAMKAGDFAKARLELSQFLASATNLTVPQKDQLSALRATIDKTEFRYDFGLSIKKGDDAIAAGDFESAGKMYEEAKAKLAVPSAAKILDKDELKRMEADANAKADSIQTQRRLAEIRMQVTEARNNKDYRMELSAVQEGLKLSPVEEWSRRLSELKSMVALDDGQQALADGRLVEARDKFVESKRLFDNAEADKALKNLEQIELRESLLTAGQSAQLAGNYAEAIKNYTDAVDLPAPAKPTVTPEALRDKIKECQYQIGLAEGDKLCEQRKFDEASKKYEELRGLSSDAATIDARLAKVKTDQEYEIFLREGNKALANQEWSKAVQQYKLAKEKKDTDEVKQLLNVTAYRQNVALGKAGLEAGEYASAIAYFKLAQQYAPPEDKKQLDELIHQAETRQKNKP
jgi:serine/threonine protein kinase